MAERIDENMIDPELLRNLEMLNLMEILGDESLWDLLADLEDVEQTTREQDSTADEVKK